MEPYSKGLLRVVFFELQKVHLIWKRFVREMEKWKRIKGPERNWKKGNKLEEIGVS